MAAKKSSEQTAPGALDTPGIEPHEIEDDEETVTIAHTGDHILLAGYKEGGKTKQLKIPSRKMRVTGERGAGELTIPASVWEQVKTRLQSRIDEGIIRQVVRN